MGIRQNIFNVSCRKVGGIRFVKLGRINISLSVSRPKRLCDVQSMRDTSLQATLNLNAVERALTARLAELNACGATMEVNYDQ